jgi:hypothetical protein
MTKKRKLVVFAVAASGLVAGPLLYLQTLPQTPLQAKYARVRLGMTVEEVDAIMGEPNPGKGKRRFHFYEAMDRYFKQHQRFSSPAGTLPAEPTEWPRDRERYGDLCEEFVSESLRFGSQSMISPDEEEATCIYFANGRVMRKVYFREGQQQPVGVETVLKLIPSWPTRLY